MSKHTLNLTDSAAIEIDYTLEDDEVIISNIQIIEGTVLELLQWFETEEGFDNLTATLAQKVNDDLVLNIGEMEDLNEGDYDDLDEDGNEF